MRSLWRCTVPGAYAEDVEGYVIWLYSDTLALETRGDACTACRKKAKGQTGSVDCVCFTSFELARIYALGDYLGDTHFCNAVVDVWKAIARTADCTPGPNSINIVWENGRTSCFLARFERLNGHQTCTQHLCLVGSKHGA